MADEEVKNVEPEVVVQSAPQPEPPKEERVIEVPVDMVAFEANIETAFRALGKARKTLEGSIPYEKFVEELVAVEKIVQDIIVRVGQLYELDSVLASTQFTNKSEVDAKIRTRVIEEISKHFKFTRIGQEVANTDDVVVLDNPAYNGMSIPPPSGYVYPSPSIERGQTTRPIVEKTGPTRDLGTAASHDRLRRQARAEALQESGLPKEVMSAYERAFEQDNAVIRENMPMVEESEEQISPEEAAQIFGDSAVNPKVEALKGRILPKKLKSGPIEPRGTNKGIARSK